MPDKFYITTTIPYVNGDPHIGHALEFVQADVIARHQRVLGRQTRLLTGTDENSLKNVQAAEKAGVSVAKFVDKYAALFKKLATALNVSNDDFIRTTEARHVQGAQKFWLACSARGDIYKKRYAGLYCIGCEAFYLKKDLENGLCPEHRIAPEHIEEENYFFKLFRYQDTLANLIESDRMCITPARRKNETLQFIKEGLEDFSISRSNERAKNWGVGVPGDASQKMYVWFDALTNYITALDYGGDARMFQEWWEQSDHTLHVIGKGVARFHVLYWPAMLLSAGLRPPKEVFIHGYFTINGEKMSKSLGTGVNPLELVEAYGTDAVRCFLLREIPAAEDGDFSYEKFEQRYNADLANGLGNLVQRVATLAEKYAVKTLDPADAAIVQIIADVERSVFAELAAYEFHRALSALWQLVAWGNKYVDERKPWQQTGKELEKTLANLVCIILQIAKALRPFLPDTAKAIFARFGVDPEIKTIGPALAISVKKGEPLFKRIQ